MQRLAHHRQMLAGVATTDRIERPILDMPGWTIGYEILDDTPPVIAGHVWKNGHEVYGSNAKELVLEAEPPTRLPREKDEAFAARVAAAEAVQRELDTAFRIWPAKMLEDMYQVAQNKDALEREQAAQAEAAQAAISIQDAEDIDLYLRVERGRILAAQQGIVVRSQLPPGPSSRQPEMTDEHPRPAINPFAGGLADQLRPDPFAGGALPDAPDYSVGTGGLSTRGANQLTGRHFDD
jgi:hypothetical protein